MGIEELSIGGMSCAACAALITKNLSEMDGVTEVNVNYASEKAYLRIDPSVVSLENVEEKISQLGYTVLSETAEENQLTIKKSDDMLKRKVFISLALTVPVVAISMVPLFAFPGWEWFVFLLSTPVVWWGGINFHKKAFRGLLQKTVSMDTLISLGSSVAWFYSTIILLTKETTEQHSLFGSTDGNYIYFETSAVIVAFLLLGKFFESKAKKRSSLALMELTSQQKNYVRMFDGSTKQAKFLQQGDVFQVLAGDRIPVDGKIQEGQGLVDISHVTGEPIPKEVSQGSFVPGGAINVNAPIWVEAERVGEDSTLNKISSLVVEAQKNKSSIELFVDKIVKIFVPVVLAIACISFLVWFLITGEAGTALNVFVAVLIIACPCALGLATPTAIIVGVGRGSKEGILIGGGPSIEKATRINKVVFDKTGTLTKGKLSIVEIIVFSSETDELVGIAKALASHSSHPMSLPITKMVSAARIPEASNIKERSGMGVEAIIDGTPVKFGSPRWFKNTPDVVTKTIHEQQEKGFSVVAVGWPQEHVGTPTIQGLFTLVDVVDEGAAKTVQILKRMKVDSVVLSGDSQKTTQHVCTQIGITEFLGGCTPEDKLNYVQQRQKEGDTVAMVGDGINDTPALAAADLSIAVGNATGAAIQTADIVIMGEGTAQIAGSLQLARKISSTIKSNLFWAFAYNIVAIPLAATGVLTPMIAAAAMSASSVFVLFNSLKLRKWQAKYL